MVSAALLSTSSAQVGITFPPPPGAPTGSPVGIREVSNNGDVLDENQARASLNSGNGRIIDAMFPVINFVDDAGSIGHFDYLERAFFTAAPPGPGQGSVTQMAAIYQGTINIIDAGQYTFNVNSDDGFTLAFDNGSTLFACRPQGAAPCWKSTIIRRMAR